MSQNLSFDDVLDDLMLEEETPSHEALVRWQKRYPQYRKQLADYFAAWAIQEAYAAGQQRTHIDEEKLVQRGVDHAMETLRKQGRLLPADYNPSVNPFDQQVLAAVYALHGQGYPVNIGEKVGEMSGSRPMLGTVLMSLNRLESKYLVSGREITADGPESPERKTGRFFTVTLAGERVLEHVKETSPAVARFLADFA